MEEKQINKYLRRQFAPVAWTLLVYHGMMLVSVVVAMILAMVFKMVTTGSTAVTPEDAAWGYVVCVAVGYLILRLWKKKAFFRDQIWAKGNPMTVGTFMTLLCLTVASQLFNSILVMIMEFILNLFGLSILAILDSVSGQSDTFGMFLYASILAPISEEILFRGFIQRSLMPYGKKFAIFCSAFLFGLFHGNLAQTPYAFVVGLVLGYTAAEYSIGWAMVLHMFNNLVLADMTERLSRFLPAGLGEGITGLLILAGSIASVVLLIVKRKKVGAYLRRECMDERCVKWFFCNAGMIILMVVMLFNIITAITPV